MIIGTNSISLSAQNYLRKSGQGLEQTMERLSSGKKINSAKDDAAGLAISERMNSKIRGMEVGIRNSNDGISLVQTAESALGSVTSIMQRMRELAVQSANGTNTGTDQASMDVEYKQLMAEIDHIAGKTSFNGVNLLNDATGTATVDIQLSDAANDTMAINLTDATSTGLTIDTTDILSAANATLAMTALDTAIGNVSDTRATYGANLNRLSFNIDNITSMKNNLSQAQSRIADADMAAESSAMTKFKILQQSGTAMLSQANQNPQQVLQLLN